MFLRPIQGIIGLRPFLNNAVDRFRLHPRQFLLIAVLGLFGNYFGFMWALTDFKPFFSDWIFFVNLSLGFLFACGICALAVQLISSLFSFLAMIISTFAPDQMMKFYQIISFKIPMLGYRVIGATVLSTLFVTFIFLIYTDLHFGWIFLILLSVPLVVAIWGLAVYWEIKNHHVEVEELKVDLGKDFVLTADTIDQGIDYIEHTEHQLEEFILSHLPDNLRQNAEQLLKHAHELATQLAEKIPEKEEVAQQIQKLQLRVADFRWDLAYARYALPRLRSIITGMTLGYCILLGYSHLGRFTDNNQGELTLASGETLIATPIAHRAQWSIYSIDGKLIFINGNELQAFTPKPLSE